MADERARVPSSEMSGPGPGADEHREPFLSRWSRLKQNARDEPAASQPIAPAADASEPAPELPPLDSLTMDSDYRQFLHPKVGEDVRRAALRKLFGDPHFNVMDGLDVYIDDYSKTEPIPPAMLASLKQAQNILRWAKGEGEDAGQAQAGEPDRSDAGPAEAATGEAHPAAAGLPDARDATPIAGPEGPAQPVPAAGTTAPS